MKKADVYFMALGGGQRVGASCYYLKVGNSNIILDSGIGNKGNEPDFMSLVMSPYMLSLSQINQIFISHAHLDHTGSLLKLMKAASHAGVYMTKPTKLFVEHQLYNKKYFDSIVIEKEEQRLASEYLLNQIIEVNFMQSISFNDYEAKFFQAGHIPGAMMTYINYENKNILYTGDYSIHSTALTGGYILPDDLEIDTLIICGLHAKHPHYQRQNNSIYRDISNIFRLISSGRNVICRLTQLSKGVEFIKILNAYNSKHIPVFIDNDIMKIVNVMEKLSEPILNVDSHSIKEFKNYYYPGIVITSSERKIRNGINLNINFSLHEDFDEMKNFIRLINPRQAVIVHCAPACSEYDATIEQEIMKDSNCRTQFIFAEDREIYVI